MGKGFAARAPRSVFARFRMNAARRRSTRFSARLRLTPNRGKEGAMGSEWIDLKVMGLGVLGGAAAFAALCLIAAVCG